MRLLLATMLAGAITGMGDPWAAQVERAAARVSAALRTEGYLPAGRLIAGTLFKGESAVLQVSLDGPGHYAVIGTCDDDCGALHLVLITPTRYEVDADDGRSPRPVLHTDAPAPGAYTVRVTMLACRVSPCRYGILVLRSYLTP